MGFSPFFQEALPTSWGAGDQWSLPSVADSTFTDTQEQQIPHRPPGRGHAQTAKAWVCGHTRSGQSSLVRPCQLSYMPTRPGATLPPGGGFGAPAHLKQFCLLTILGEPARQPCTLAQGLSYIYIRDRSRSQGIFLLLRSQRPKALHHSTPGSFSPLPLRICLFMSLHPPTEPAWHSVGM